MATLTYATRPGDVPRGTLVDLFLDTVDRLGDHVSFRLFTDPSSALTDLTCAGFYARVRDAVGVPARDVVLVEPGTIPKTSSGKLQRSLCKARYHAGELAS
jgi:acyl-CoA synthetase (AMP-forming)/AMP-acid ligase II